MGISAYKTQNKIIGIVTLRQNDEVLLDAHILSPILSRITGDIP